MQDFHQHGHDGESNQKDGDLVCVNPFRSPADVVQHVAGAQSACDEEVEDAGDADAAEDGDAVAQVFFIFKGKDNTCEPHDNQAHDKSDGDREEDADDDGKRFVGVDEFCIGHSRADHF